MVALAVVRRWVSGRDRRAQGIEDEINVVGAAVIHYRDMADADAGILERVRREINVIAAGALVAHSQLENPVKAEFSG